MTTPTETVEDLLAFHAHCIALRKVAQGNARRLRRIARRAERDYTKSLDEEEKARVALSDFFAAIHHKPKAP